MDSGKIESIGRLEKWLTTQEARVCSAFAARASLRSLPAIMARIDQSSPIMDGTTSLRIAFRATLISSVASFCPPEKQAQLRSSAQSAALYGASQGTSAHLDALNSAHFAVLTISESAVTSAISAVRSSARATSFALSSIDSALLRDLEFGKSNPSPESFFAQELWPKNSGIAPMDDQWHAFSNRPDPDNIWEFWCDWYQGMLVGTPMDWDLQMQVALIEDAIWEAGPIAVTAEIEAIKAKTVVSKLPLEEVIKLNLETGKFHAVPTPVQNAPLLSALLTQVSDALEDAVAGNNGLSEQSSEFRKLTRTFQRYGNDPQQAELTLTTVAKGLRRQIHESRELPDSEDNLALLEAVEDGVRGIRAHHPEVAANREQLAHQAFKVMNPADKETLSQALPLLTALSETALAEDFSADIPELINDTLLPLPDGAPRLPGADATTRVFSRVSKMALAWEQVKALSESGAKIFDSKIVKSLRLVGFATAGLGAVGTLLYQLVQIGLRALGVL